MPTTSVCSTFFSWQKGQHWRRFALMLLLALTLLAWMMLIIWTLAHLDAWSSCQ
jgi:hypothetical protein